MTDDQIIEIVDEEPVVNQVEETQEQQSEEPQEPKRKDAEYNFKELRRQREEDKKRADEAERRYEDERRRTNEILELYKQRNSAQTVQERDLIEEELAKLSPDDLTTVDNVDKKISSYHKKSSKEVKELKEELQTIKTQLEEQRLRTQYPDLDQVVSVENLQKLKEDDPELAEMIYSMPTGSKQQVALAYKYIKRLLPPKDEITQEKVKALENSRKPMLSNASRQGSALSQANSFEVTPDILKQKYKEMQDAIKGRG